MNRYTALESVKKLALLMRPVHNGTKILILQFNFVQITYHTYLQAHNVTAIHFHTQNSKKL